MDAQVAKQIADSFTRMVEHHNALFTETRLLHNLLRSHGLLTEVELKDDPQALVPMGPLTNVPVVTEALSQLQRTTEEAWISSGLPQETSVLPESVQTLYNNAARELKYDLPAILGVVDAEPGEDLAPPKDLTPATVVFEDHSNPANVRRSPEYTLGEDDDKDPRSLNQIITDNLVFTDSDTERLPPEEPEILLHEVEEEAEAELLNVLATVKEVNDSRQKPLSVESEVAHFLAQSKEPVSESFMDHTVRVMRSMKGMTTGNNTLVLGQGIGAQELATPATFSVKPILAEEEVPQPKPAAEGEAKILPPTDVIGDLFAEILRDMLDPSVMRHAKGTVKNWDVFQEDLMRTPHRFIQKWPSGIYLSAADKSKQLLINVSGKTQFVFSNIDKLLPLKGWIKEPVKEHSFVLTMTTSAGGGNKPFVLDAGTPPNLLENYQQHFGAILRSVLEARQEVTG